MPTRVSSASSRSSSTPTRQLAEALDQKVLLAASPLAPTGNCRHAEAQIHRLLRQAEALCKERCLYVLNLRYTMHSASWSYLEKQHPIACILTGPTCSPFPISPLALVLVRVRR